MLKIRTQKVFVLFFSPKLINIILYFNYYFIIFLRRPILYLKIHLMEAIAMLHDQSLLFFLWVEACGTIVLEGPWGYFAQVSRSI